MEEAKEEAVYQQCPPKDVGLLVANAILGMIVAAAVFVAALSWNEAIKANILAKSRPEAAWVYAAIVTVIVAIFAIAVAFARLALDHEGGKCYRALVGAIPEFAK